MPLFIDPAWEYYEPDPDVAYVFAASARLGRAGNRARRSSDWFAIVCGGGEGHDNDGFQELTSHRRVHVRDTKQVVFAYLFVHYPDMGLRSIAAQLKVPERTLKHWKTKMRLVHERRKRCRHV